MPEEYNIAWAKAGRAFAQKRTYHFIACANFIA